MRTQRYGRDAQLKERVEKQQKGAHHHGKSTNMRKLHAHETDLLPPVYLSVRPSLPNDFRATFGEYLEQRLMDTVLFVFSEADGSENRERV